MTDPKKKGKPSDKDFETHSRVEIDGTLSGSPIAREETARLPRMDATAPERTLVSGASASHSAPGTPTAPAKAPATPAASRAASPLVGTVLGGRFEVMQSIGVGGMGEVFLVRDRQIENREVALKLVLPRWSADARFRDLFFKEIRAAQGFVSEHAVQVRDCGQLPDGQLFLTMDFVEGESLTSLLKREKSLMPRHALEIARQVLLGLSSGHEKGFIHRDVKPSNVMLAARIAKTSENPHGVKVGLLDFGIAGLTQDMEAGLGPGTPHYMSPEQASGEPLDSRSDLFAVGVMLFEMISGTRPFEGRTLEEITTSVIDTDPIPLVDRLDGIKKPIKKVLRKALQKKREKRYSSAADFIRAIESCTSFKQTEGAPRWVAAAAGVMTVTAAGFAWQNFDLRSQARDQSQDRRIDAGESRAEMRAKLVPEIRAEVAQPYDLQIKEFERQRSEQSALALRNEEEIRSLGAQLKEAEVAADRAQKNQNTAVSNSNRETITQQMVITLLKDHIEDLVVFSQSTFGQRGRNLCSIGEVFDRLTARIIDGSLDERSRIVESAINGGGVDSGAPGVPYLARVEELAKRIHASGAQSTTGNESFAALASIRATFDELSSEDARRTFERDTSSLDESGSSRRMWLALKRLGDEELANFLVKRGQEQSEPTVESTGKAVEAAAQVSEEGLTEAERQEALEEAKDDVASASPVLRKEALSRFLRLHTPQYVVDALYGAQLDEGTRDRRLTALDNMFAALENQLDEQHERLLVAAEKRVQEIASNGDPTSSTADVVSFLDDFRGYAGAYAGPLIDGLIADYQQAIVVDGNLELSGLQELPRQLDSLVSRVLESRELGYEIEQQTQVDLFWIAGARHWYLRGGGSSSEAAWFADFGKTELERPISSYSEPWKRLLAFQYQLKTRCDLMQGRASARLFAAYSSGDEPAVQTDWQLIRIVEGQGEGELLLEERYYNLDGRLQKNGKKPPLEIEAPTSTSSSVEWKGRFLLRLTDIPEQANFVEWEPRLAGARELFEQSNARVFSNMNRNTNLALIAGAPPLLCLEVTDSRGSTYLVHPTLGVVRQQRKLHDYELVHLEL